MNFKEPLPEQRASSYQKATKRICKHVYVTQSNGISTYSIDNGYMYKYRVSASTKNSCVNKKAHTVTKSTCTTKSIFLHNEHMDTCIKHSLSASTENSCINTEHVH